MTDEAWDAHEAALVADAYRAHEHYDKTIIALSGGALGVSLVFAHDIVGANAGHGWLWLLGAWALWTLSLSATLLSYYTSLQANWHEIEDCRRLRRVKPSVPLWPEDGGTRGHCGSIRPPVSSSYWALCRQRSLCS